MKLNNAFLNKIIEQREHDVYARITALNNNEEPLDQIEGKITSGSINIDGDSTVRRTCSLTLINNNININEFYWGIKTKFKLEIGLYNYLLGEYSIQNGYPDVVWFPQGIYVVSTFNTSLSTNNCTISISGKDKMSLLNGELGGQLFSSIDFGTEETIKEEMIKMEQNLYDNSIRAFDAYGYKYYIKCSNSIVNKNTATVDDEELYPKYIFIIANNDTNEFNNNDEFYTLDKKTYYRIGNLSNGYNLPSNSIKYHIYQAITSPLELYEEITPNPYEANKYYYKNTVTSDSYFMLDSSSSALINTTYYNPITIYQRKINVNKEKIIIEKIIREAVHAYAGEPYHNIIIKDLNEYGLEKMTYKGDSTVYIIYNVLTEEDENIFFGELKINDESITKVFNETDYYNQLDGGGTYIYIKNGKYTTDNSNGTVPYQVKKITYGDDIGYQFTPLTYAGDLIANIGETLTSVLDKIKTMLGEFEYFYDLNGKFIFQKKKNYLQTSWSQLTLNENNEPYIDFNNEKFSYEFLNSYLVTAIQNTPVINNVRNDFTVWGKRKGLSGADKPIHARYAIDKKPLYYKSLNNTEYSTKEFFNQQIEEEIGFSLLDNPLDDIIRPGAAKIDINNKGQWSDGWWNIKTWLSFYEEKNNEDLTNDTSSIFEKFFNKNFSINDLKNILNRTLGVNNYEISDLSSDGKYFFIYISFDPASNKYKIQILSGISQKVKNYRNRENYFIYTPKTSQDYLINYHLVDWREIIYQMALDYFSAQGCSETNKVYLGEENQYLTNPDNFLYEVGKRNPDYYPTGYTGYEQYYTDLQGFWRQLYNPDYIPIVNYSKSSYENRQLIPQKVEDLTIDYYCNKNSSTIISWEYILRNDCANFTTEEYNNFLNQNHYYDYIIDNTSDRLYWNKAVFEEPETLNFWFDFLDSEGTTDLGQFSIPQIGDRSKVINEDKASSIIFKEVSNSIFINGNLPEKEKQEKVNEFPGYSIIDITSEHLQYFTISTKTLSVKNKIDDLLYQHTYCTENTTITSVPIYHLQPNTRILVKDDETGINGEYIIHKLTIPLTYNGTMSIQASKAPERLC